MNFPARTLYHFLLTMVHKRKTVCSAEYRVHALPEQIAMKKSIPAIHETPEELRRLLHAERDAQQQQRVQALYLTQTQQARTRLQVAHLLGVSRHTVGRWLAADEAGGVAQLLTIAKAPGNAPLLSPAMPHALQER